MADLPIASYIIHSESQVLPTVAFNGYIPVGETLVTDIPVLMRVDMSGYSGTVGNVYLSGTLNGWSGDCCQLLDDGTNGDQFAGRRCLFTEYSSFRGFI